MNITPSPDILTNAVYYHSEPLSTFDDWAKEKDEMMETLFSSKSNSKEKRRWHCLELPLLNVIKDSAQGPLDHITEL